MTAQTTRFVRRYRPVQRYLHWMGALGFVLVLITGSVLVWPRHIPVGTCCAIRQIHRVGALLFALWPVLYAVFDRHAFLDLIKEAFTWTRSDIAWFKYALPYFFGRTRNVPPQGRINAGQKLQHLGVILLSLVMGASGVVLLLGAGRLDANSLSITATIHDAGMLGLAILTIGHVYFVFLYGGLDAMLKGYVTEAYARMEHAKWLASLPESAFIVPGQNETKPLAQMVGEQAAKPEDKKATGAAES
jgi:formate dehydrogenase subunit gamma